MNQLFSYFKRIKQIIKYFQIYRRHSYRFHLRSHYVEKRVEDFFSWLVNSKELTNMTYDITDINKEQLIHFTSNLTNKPYNTIKSYLNEILNDENLKSHIISNSVNDKFADKNAYYGRRLGWYIFVRALKPKVVIETGIDKGLGSCVLSSAIKKNKEEGYEGKYFGTELSETNGYLFSKPYSNYGEIIRGDSVESLKMFSLKIDLFINDSDHSKEYEALEYETIKNKLSENAYIIGDNSHESTALYEFSNKNNRSFLFFKEEPLNHFYPGAGIGVSYIKNQS